MKEKYKFEGGEIVRIKSTINDGLEEGCYGYVWGVCDDPEYLEASFVTASGEFEDYMFEPEEVEVVSEDNIPKELSPRLKEIETLFLGPEHKK